MKCKCSTLKSGKILKILLIFSIGKNVGKVLSNTIEGQINHLYHWSCLISYGTWFLEIQTFLEANLVVSVKILYAYVFWSNDVTSRDIVYRSISKYKICTHTHQMMLLEHCSKNKISEAPWQPNSKRMINLWNIHTMQQ